MNIAANANKVFDRCVADYHLHDNIDYPIRNPYAEGTLDHTLYAKCWIDAVQWHLEDLIRDPDIDPQTALALKRRIDTSNQERTDMVERIDDYFLDMFRNVKPVEGAGINTESPAWAIDRLSILALKLWHMKEQSSRTDTTSGFKKKTLGKLTVLLEQRPDLTTAIDELLEDMLQGRKVMKVYRQMKLYNDPETNPVLYGKK